MATGYYVVYRDPNAAVPTFDGVSAMIVVAESSSDAKLLAASAGDGDGAWSGATATLLAAAADLEGWTLRVVLHKLDGTVAADVTVTGAAGATVDSIGALMDTALSALTATANASYNSTTQVLIVAAGGSDALGDGTLTVEFKPPQNATYPDPVDITGMYGTIVDQGMSSDDVKVTLATDAYTKGKVAFKFAQR